MTQEISTDKIKKLIVLSLDPNTGVNESTSAFNKAREFIEQNNISVYDLFNDKEIKTEEVIHEKHTHNLKPVKAKFYFCFMNELNKTADEHNINLRINMKAVDDTCMQCELVITFWGPKEDCNIMKKTISKLINWSNSID